MSSEINGVNGNYNTLNYPTRTEKTTKPSSINDANLKKDESSPEPRAVTNHTIPVTQADKTDEIYDSKNNTAPMGHVQLSNIASLVTIIEDSHKVLDDSNQLANSGANASLFPEVPQSNGQLIMLAADTSDNVDAQFINEIIDNFSEVDTNHDNLVSSTEALAFIDKN